MNKIICFSRSVFFKLILSSLIFACFSNKGSATNYTWVGPAVFGIHLGGSGDWNTSSNWSPSAVPGATDSVTFNELLAGFSVSLSQNVTVKSIGVYGILSLLGPANINTGTHTLTVSNYLTLGAYYSTTPSIVVPTLFTINGSGSVAFGSASKIIVYTGGILNLGQSGQSINLNGGSINLVNFVPTNLLSGVLSLLSTTGPTINNYGTTAAYSSSVLNLSGYYAQFNNYSTFNAGPSTTINLSGNYSNLTNSSVFNLGPTAVLNLSNGLAYVTNTGTFTLVSSATSSATIAKVASGATLTGNFNVQRYFAKQSSGTTADNTRNYRLLSNPVNVNSVKNDASATAYYNLQYLNINSGGLTGVFTAGPGGTGNGFSVANATPTIYLYKESLTASNATFNGGNFKGIANIAGNSTVTVYNDAGTAANINATLYSGNGYMLYYAGNNTANVSSTTALNKQYRYAGSYIAVDTAVATAIGTLNQGSIPVKLWWNSSTTLSDAQSGYNLVGDPYASSIDWDTFNDANGDISGTNVSNTAWIFNYTTKNYGVYQAGTGGVGSNNATHVIASGQGFFVTATAAGGAALTFTEGCKTNVQPNNVGGNNPSYLLLGLPKAIAQTQLLRVKVAKDSVNTDDIMILFDPGSSNAYEKYIDADRLNGIGNISTLASYSTNSNVMLAVNHMHSIDSTTRIKLYVDVLNSTGIDSLTGSGFNSLDPRYDVFLLDHYKKDSLQFSVYHQYLFNINNADTTTYGANRFEIVFHKKSGLNYRLLSFTGTRVSGGIKLTWRTLNEQNLTGFQIQRQDGSLQFVSLNAMQSDSAGTYSYIDTSPLTGTNYYRLQQDDAFDNISYSNIISVNTNTAYAVNNSLLLYPNPVANQFNVKINADVPNQVILKVTNAQGQTIINNSMEGNNIQQAAGNLIPGSYIVQVINSDTKKVIGVTKFIKQ